MRFKASETLLGIETKMLKFQCRDRRGFKASETLLGIETVLPVEIRDRMKEASKPLKPF